MILRIFPPENYLLTIYAKCGIFIPQTNYMKFGKYIKEKREAAGIGLREFSRLAGVDASNWSKVERGRLPYSADRKRLGRIGKILGIKSRSKEMQEFLDVAAISQNKIPDDIVKEESASYNLTEKFKEIREDVRISVPYLKTEKFRNLLLYVLENTAGKANVGETVLYKLLYFIDFNYYEIYEEQLTGATYRKLEHGPVPFKIDEILADMEKRGEIKTIKTEYYGFPQKRYLPLVKPDLTKLKASEKDVTDKAIEQLSDMTAKGIKEYSHNDIPWTATKDKDKIDYELVFYRTPPYSQRVYKEEEDEFSGD